MGTVTMTKRTPPRRRGGNAAAWTQAQAYLAHGVNSPVRSFSAVGGEPVFAVRGRGPHLWDASGRRYLDYVGGWGALILGHVPQPVLQAIARQLRHGTTFGMPTALETALARRICAAFPSIQRVRFTSSGTEACMTAIRLARAATKRSKILKFAGCYHGHADAFLVRAGSGLATFAGGTSASSAGVPPAVMQDTLVAPYNDVEAVRAVFARHADDVAAVIVEPWAANMGLVLPQPGFLDGLRQVTRQHRSLLIFDEVITGFRVTYGGVQHLAGVEPDLTILGKIIGGGLPVGAVGGRHELMELLAPQGPVYQAGTLSGHPLAMAAGLATLDTLQRTSPYTALTERTETLARGLRDIARARGIPLQVNAGTGLLTCFFTGEPVVNFSGAQRTDAARFSRVFQQLRATGVLLPPSAYEAWFLSATHGERDIEATVRAVARALAA